MFIIISDNLFCCTSPIKKKEGQFLHATGITAAADGHIYVAEYEGRRVQKFDTDGSFMTSWQVGGDTLGTPEGLAVDEQGNVYVTDCRLAQVEVYSPDGEFLTHWGERGTGDLQFQAPVAVVVDSAGNIYVSDQKTNSVQKIVVSP